MSNYKRPVIIWGNSFYINIELKQFNKDTSEYEYFDLTKCHDVKVNLICATHNTVIPLEWNLLEGYNYIIRCFVDYRLLHNTSYGVEVEGLNEDDIHWRWYMLPKEGLLVVNNSSGLNIPDEVTTVDLAGRVGWGIQTDADLTNYYTKTEVNNLIDESTDNSPYILECWQEIDEDLRKTLAEYIQNSRDIILHEGDGADLKLFEYTIGRDNEVTFMVFHTDMGEEGTSEVTQYYWRIPYNQEANNGWSVSTIDFLTSSDRLEVTWDGVAISDGAEDPTYTYKISGNHTYKEFIDIVNEGKTIQLAIHPEDQNSVAHGYRGIPDYTVTLFTCFSAINVITTYFYAVLYNYFEWEGRVTSNGLYVYVLRVDPDKTEYPNDQTKWKIKLTEERIDTIEMQKKTDENTEQLDNIELNVNNNNLILQTTLDETPKVFSRVGMKTINNQSLLGTGNIEIQGSGDEQVQSDWNETDTTSPAYIQNKPDIQSIEGSIADVQNDIDNLEDDIAAQQAEISGIQTVVSGHQTAIQNQNSEISGIQSAVENLDTEKQDKLESGVNIKTVNGESILGEGNITIESGADVEPAKIVVTDEEVQDPDPDAVYIVQKPINLKTINGEEIVGEGNIVIESGGGTQVQSDWNETDTTSPAYIQNKPDITSIEGNIADVQNDIDNLEDDIAAQQVEISGVQTAISGHQTAIQNQATEISGMQTQISGHQTAIQNQATEISGMQTNISGMQTSIAGHQTAIENQATQISGMQTVLAGHQTAIEALGQQSGGGDPVYEIILDYQLDDRVGTTIYKTNGVFKFNLLVKNKLTNEIVYNTYNVNNLATAITYIRNTYNLYPRLYTDGYNGYSELAINGLSIARETATLSYYINPTYLVNNNGKIIINGIILRVLDNTSNDLLQEYYVNILQPKTTNDLYNDSGYITSTTSGLKIEVVSALPASPDANTIYIIQ